MGKYELLGIKKLNRSLNLELENNDDYIWGLNDI